MGQSNIAVDLILKKLAESTEKAKSRAQKASEVLLNPLETDLATTPYEVAYEEDRVKLKHYMPKEVKFKLPILVVYALINRETMLDLQPGRSVVQNFLDAGLEVYMIDWGYPTRKDQFVTIDDHVNVYMDHIVDFIRHKHDVPKIHLMGICMGGAFSVMYSSLHPEKIKNLVTTVTPTNFDTDKGLLHVWMRNSRAQLMGDTYANMPGDVMNLGFLLLNPARLILDKYVGFLEHMDNKAFVENFVRMEKWIFDSPDVPGATFRQFITDCYQKNLLIRSKLELGGKRVDLSNITMPLLNIYGQFDHLVPPEACELLTRNVGSVDTEDMVLKTGHIGIYVSSKCQKEFSPKILGWLGMREEDEQPARSGTGTKAKKAAPKPKAAPAKKKTTSAKPEKAAQAKKKTASAPKKTAQAKKKTAPARTGKPKQQGKAPSKPSK